MEIKHHFFSGKKGGSTFQARQGDFKPTLAYFHSSKKSASTLHCWVPPPKEHSKWVSYSALDEKLFLICCLQYWILEYGEARFLQNEI